MRARGDGQSSWRRRTSRRDSAEAGGPARFFVQPVGATPAVTGPQPVELLHAQPRAWSDLRGSAELVRFAFEGGDFAGVFDALTEALPLAPPELVPEAYAPQVHLDELIRACLRIQIDLQPLVPNPKILRRVLESPPADGADCAARQDVLRELSDQPTLRADLERLYLAMRRLRDALETPSSAEPNAVRRKTSVLVGLQLCVNAMADGFEGAASLLAGLRARGQSVRDTPHFQRLAELVDLEGHLAEVDVRVRLASNGTIRAFSVLAVRENDQNALLPGALVRLLQRVTAFLRGHRYGESEIVMRLLEEVFAPLADDVVAILAMTGAVELYLASLGFRDLAEKRGLRVCLPELLDAPSLDSSDAPDRVLESLFNPLLFLQPQAPIPCTLPPAPYDALVVVTGPNSGGKTRLLQSLALTQLLAQVGLFVPAARARLVRSPRLFLSLLTDTDAAQVEGRLGTELLRIRKLFEQLEPGSVAILDELCSGTNPTEGEPIFEMVVALLSRLRAQVFVSTHFLGLAARLEKSPPVPGLAFLQVELDASERPTYQFVRGVATTSLAHKVAERLGVTREALEHLIDEKTRKRR